MSEAEPKVIDKTAIKLRNLKPFKSGKEWNGNALGRPKGSVGFDQIWKRTIKKVAEEEGITPEEAEVNLLVAAYKQAKRGNSHYFKEIMDRKFGKVKEQVEHSGELGIKPIYDPNFIKAPE